MNGRFVSAAPDAIRDRRGAPVDLIVIHTMEGTLKGSIAWFATPGRAVPTAAHYLIGDSGEVVQMVPDANKALHAKGVNERSIGIEHEGYAANGGFAAPMLSASAHVVAILCKKYGIPIDRAHIVGHSECPGNDHTDPGGLWPWESYMALVAGFARGDSTG